MIEMLIKEAKSSRKHIILQREIKDLQIKISAWKIMILLTVIQINQKNKKTKKLFTKKLK